MSSEIKFSCQEIVAQTVRCDFTWLPLLVSLTSAVQWMVGILQPVFELVDSASPAVCDVITLEQCSK